MQGEVVGGEELRSLDPGEEAMGWFAESNTAQMERV
jgi:hypothetical protein